MKWATKGYTNEKMLGTIDLEYTFCAARNAWQSWCSLPTLSYYNGNFAGTDKPSLRGWHYVIIQR